MGVSHGGGQIPARLGVAIRRTWSAGFILILVLGTSALITSTLIVWPVNGTAGGVTMCLAILAWGAIARAEAGKRRHFAWSRHGID